MAVPERDPMSDGYWLAVQDERVIELEAEVERLREFAGWARARGLAKDDSILANQAKRALNA